MNSIAVNNLSTTNLSTVGSADDALDMQQAIQFVVSDKIRNSILVRIDNTKNIGQRLLETNTLLTRLRDTNPGNYQAITLSKFLAAKDSESDLINLLQSDGPKLGNSLINSQNFLNDLSQLNLSIKTNIRYPVLKTTLDKDDNVISTEFIFMNQSQRDSLNSLEKFKDDNLRPIFSELIPGDSPIAIHYESFDSFANLIPSLDDINTSITQLGSNRDSLQNQFSKELAVLSASAMKIQEKLLLQQLFSKEDESNIKKNLEIRKNELFNALNDFELLKNIKYKNIDQDSNKNKFISNSNATKENFNTIDISNLPVINDDVSNLENKLNNNNFSTFNSNNVISIPTPVSLTSDLKLSVSNSDDVSNYKVDIDDKSDINNSEFDPSSEGHTKNLATQKFIDKSIINVNPLNGYVQSPTENKSPLKDTKDSDSLILQLEKIDNKNLDLKFSFKKNNLSMNQDENKISPISDLRQSKVNNSLLESMTKDASDAVSKK
jgi:hypothetical protein